MRASASGARIPALSVCFHYPHQGPSTVLPEGRGTWEMSTVVQGTVEPHRLDGQDHQGVVTHTPHRWGTLRG